MHIIKYLCRSSGCESPDIDVLYTCMYTLHVDVSFISQGGNRPVTSSMDDSDDEFDQLAPPDSELDKV